MTWRTGRRLDSSGRLESIQVLRAIAALAVVYNHAVNLLVQAPGSGMTDSVLGPSRAVGQVGAIGVDLFFVISGFVMTMGARRFLGARDATRFMALRYVRIAPPYYVFALVLLAGLLYLGRPPSMQSLLNTLTFVPVFDDEDYSFPVHYLGWTLAFEFVFYLFVATAIAGRLRDVAQPLLALLLVLPVLGFVVMPDTAPWRIATSPMMWEFALGVAAYLLFTSGRLRWWAPVLPGLAAIAASWTATGVLVWPEGFSAISREIVDGPRTSDVRRVLYWGVPMFALFLWFVGWGIGSGRDVVSRSMRVLGDASYSIYLAHLLVVERLASLLRGGDLHPDAAIVLAVSASIGTGLLSYRWIETPLLRLGRLGVDRLLPPRSRAVPAAR